MEHQLRSGRNFSFLIVPGICLLALGMGLAVTLRAYGIALDRQSVVAFLLWAHGMPFALPLIVALYVASGFILFPIVVLNLACAMVFGPVWGVLYGLAGSLANAVFFFWMGRALGWARSFRTLLKKGRLQKIDAALRESGVMGITLIRFVPLAPFALFNLVAGVSSVGFGAFIAGTALALLPGAVGRGILGDSLMQVFLHPDRMTIAYLLAGLAFWAGIVYTTHLTVRRHRRSGKTGMPR